MTREQVEKLATMSGEHETLELTTTLAVPTLAQVEAWLDSQGMVWDPAKKTLKLSDYITRQIPGPPRPFALFNILASDKGGVAVTEHRAWWGRSVEALVVFLGDVLNAWPGDIVEQMLAGEVDADGVPIGPA